MNLKKIFDLFDFLVKIYLKKMKKLIFLLIIKIFIQYTFINVNIIDVENGIVRPNYNVIINSGIITNITRFNKHTKINHDKNIINGENKFLIPGLFDLHGHFIDVPGTPFVNNSKTAGLLSVANGILYYQELGTHLRSILELKRRYDSGVDIGPEVYHCGTGFEGNPGIFNKLNPFRNV
jgi:imidazolonepropionase-like amidohydrolase